VDRTLSGVVSVLISSKFLLFKTSNNMQKTVDVVGLSNVASSARKLLWMQCVSSNQFQDRIPNLKRQTLISYQAVVSPSLRIAIRWSGGGHACMQTALAGVVIADDVGGWSFM
jgi:hypothetical protein